MEEQSSSGNKAERLRSMALAIGRLERRLARLQQTSYRLSWVRFAIFAAGLLASGFAYELFGLPVGVLCFAVAATLFAVSVYFHRRLERGIARHRFWRDLRATQIARATLDWEHMPPARPGTRVRNTPSRPT